jgi:excisionase family DNA binding protein
MNQFYTTHEAARLLEVSLPTVVNWIRARRLRCHRTPGGHRRIAREDLATFMLLHGVPLPEELRDAAPSRRTALVVGALGPAREGTVRQLSAAGWSVEQASPGFAAGAAVARFSPQALVLLAGEESGGETLQALRADRDLATLPVVAVGHAGWQEALRRAGATAVVARPVTPEALARALDEATGVGPSALRRPARTTRRRPRRPNRD